MAPKILCVVGPTACGKTAMGITLMGACGLRILWIYTIFQIPKCHTLACLYQSYPVSWIITFLVESIIFLIIVKRKENSKNLLQQRSIA